MKLLSKLSEGDSADLSENSKFTFSYVSGGLRAQAVGPCRVTFTKAGPVLVTGQKDQLTITRPQKRVGVSLPTAANLVEGGHIRRGELSLQISRKILPGEQRINFSGLPSTQTFHLTVSNASTYVDVFEGEAVKGQSFLLPKGLLRPGQSYDFHLQGLSSSGQSEVEKEKVVVLSEDIASRLAGITIPESVGPENFAEATELLSIYLEHDLDVEALQLTQMMLKSASDHPELLTIEENLKQHLQLAD